jgi:PAS domain S-box-containing protein
MIYRSASLTRTLSVLTAIISLIIAVSIPAGYFMITYQHMEGSTNAEGTLSAQAIERLVANNPDSWHFEEIRLQEILHRHLDHNTNETRIIRGMQGQIIAQAIEPLSDPVLTFSHPIYDSGIQVARIEIKRSALPLIARTAIISVCSFLIGIMIFLTLRFFPLRAIGKAYNALEENEQRLELALASGRFGVLDWDVNKNVMIWNDRMYEIYGVSRGSVKTVTEAWQNGIHPEDRDRVLGNFQYGVFEGRDYSTEFRIVQPDGTVRYIKGAGIVIKDADEKPSRIIGLFYDITSRRQAEEEREKLILELRETLSQVKTLRGLLPICSSCKKIRNDKGYWEQMEIYIKDHSGVEFSHGICPECAEKLYPEFYKKK